MKVGSKIYVVLDDDGDIVDLSAKKEEAIFMAGVAARAMHNHSMSVVEATINTMIYGVCYGGECKENMKEMYVIMLDENPYSFRYNYNDAVKRLIEVKEIFISREVYLLKFKLESKYTLTKNAYGLVCSNEEV